MIYKTQCEAIRVCRKDFSAINFYGYFLLLGDLPISYNFHDSKQKARLKFYFDLLEKYQYPVGRIEFDVIVPSGGRLADIAVFKDDKRKIPYIIVECCRDGISDAVFEIGIKTAIAKAEAFGAEFAVCATRLKRRIIKLTHTSGATYAKTVCDLPVLYGEGE